MNTSNPIDKDKERVFTCSHCGNQTLMKIVATYTPPTQKTYAGSIWDEDGEESEIFVEWDRKWTVLYCPSCENPTFIEWVMCSEWYEPEESVLYPNTNVGKENLPKEVEDCFKAALRVRNLDGVVCAIALRRTLEKMCKHQEKENKEKNERKFLSQRIIDLFKEKEKQLPVFLSKQISLLKELGNAAAHADNIEHYSEEEVEAMIDLTSIILDYVYVLPKKFESIQDLFTKSRPEIAEEAEKEAQKIQEKLGKKSN